MEQGPAQPEKFESLLEVVRALRGPQGCPWDKEQTHQTLTQYAIEEAYELAEALDSGKQAHIIEELGDLLFQVVLHSEIARQENAFEISDVIARITSKMVSRHPHVFGSTKVKNSGEVLENWQKIKDAEKKSQQHSDSADGSAFKGFDIPAQLPALIRSQKIGSKTKKMNFDWERVEDVVAKVDEELQELKEALKSGTSNDQQAELGDLLFSVTQLARHLNFDAEQALRMTNSRFENRFIKMQEIAHHMKKDFMQLSATELNQLWEQAKLEFK